MQAPPLEFHSVLFSFGKCNHLMRAEPGYTAAAPEVPQVQPRNGIQICLCKTAMSTTVRAIIVKTCAKY